MGRKSIKEGKSHLQLCRESCSYTREGACERMRTISEDRLEKLENDKIRIHPEDIVEMAEAYGQPELCNWFCREMCTIGQQLAPAPEPLDLTQSVMSIMHRINLLTAEKDRMIALAADGQITEDEQREFSVIYTQLDQLSDSIESLKVWLRKALANGKIVHNPFECE